MSDLWNLQNLQGLQAENEKSCYLLARLWSQPCLSGYPVLAGDVWQEWQQSSR